MTHRQARRYALPLKRRLLALSDHVPPAHRASLHAAAQCLWLFEKTEAAKDAPPTLKEAYRAAKRYETRRDVRVRRAIDRWCAQQTAGGTWGHSRPRRAWWHLVRAVQRRLRLVGTWDEQQRQERLEALRP
jgi:hypothetical protein